MDVQITKGDRMKALRLMLLGFATSLVTAHAAGQEFECVETKSGGVELFASSSDDNMLRCEVTCQYMRSDRSKATTQSCKFELRPKQPRTKVCSFNVRDADQATGHSHSCDVLVQK
jgi:hypothetical protein